MTSLAELGEISKAQEDEKNYRHGRYLAAGGGAATLAGAGLGAHGVVTHMKDATKYAPYIRQGEHLGEKIKEAGGPTRTRLFGFKGKGPIPRGTHRMGAGGLLLTGGGLALGAAPIAGGVNMYRKRKDRRTES